MLEFIKINYKSVLSLVILETRTRSLNKKFYHKVNIIVHILLRISYFFFYFYKDIKLHLPYIKFQYLYVYSKQIKSSI